MKKFFSLIAAVLFAGSMMATTVTKTVAELAVEKSFTNSAVCTPFALDDVITVSTSASDANTGKYYSNGEQIRLYQTGAASITLTAAEGYKISSVTLTYASQNTGILVEAKSGVSVGFDNVQSATFTVGNSGTATNGQVRITAFSVTYDADGAVPPTPADTYTVAGAPASIFGEEWNPALAANDMTLANGVYTWTKANLNLTVGAIEFKVVKNHSWDNPAYPAQNYVLNIAEDGEYTITITFDPATEAVAAGAGKKEPLADPTNCAEAAAAALSVSANNELYNNGAVYTIEGYVTGIKTAYSDQYHNISFWMADAADGGEVLQAYRAACASEADAPNVGDKVSVTGKLTKYNTTPEFAAACTYTILERAEVVPPVNLGEKTIAEFLELKNVKDTCVITGVVYNIYNAEYGNLYLVDGTDTLNVYGVLTPQGESKKFAELNVAEGDTLTVKAVYALYNNKPQVKNAIFVEVKKAGSVTPGAEVEITIADGSFGDYVESSGYWMVEAQNADYYIILSNYDLEITQAADTYTAADLDPEYSYILTETDSISFVSGSIVLAVDAEGVATVTGSLVGNDGNTYILNIACPAAGEYEYDDDSDFIRNFSAYTINTDYLSEYGDIYVEAEDTEGYQIVLDLYVPTGASGLVAGTYEINNTYAAGTVASGLFYEGIYPSYAGKGTSEGLTNVWYLVSGTVVVDANLNITVNAVNSLSHTIKVTLSAASHTGIEETLAAGKAAKVLRNGQIQIMKGDKTFNVTGARIR